MSLLKSLSNRSSSSSPSTSPSPGCFKVIDKGKLHPPNLTNSKEVKLPAKLDGHVRFVILSDTHFRLNEPLKAVMPAGDVLVHCGDFSTFNNLDHIDKFFTDFLASLKSKYKHVLVVNGNHDAIFEPDFKERYSNRGVSYVSRGSQLILQASKYCKMLFNETVDVEGIKVHGVGWNSGCMSMSSWNQIKKPVDVMVTHGPVFDHCHRTACHNLLHTLQRLKPVVHLHGHVHGDGHSVKVVNKVTTVNAANAVGNRPFVFDIRRR